MFTQSHFKEFAVYDNQLKGQPIVFLHGLGANATYGEFLVAAYPANRIVLIDLPAHGASQYADSDIDVYKIALDLFGLLEHYGIEQPIICGHSLGGQIAFLYDIVHPNLTKSLILLSPAGLEDYNGFQKQAVLSSLSFGNFMHQLFIPKINTSIKVAGGRTPDGSAVSDYIKSMLERPVNDLLDRISCPVTVIFGENDTLIPNRLFNMDSAVVFAHKVLDKYPNFRIFPLTNCGHWPMAENLNGLVKLLKEKVVV